jgi:hypothetical protein
VADAIECVQATGLDALVVYGDREHSPIWRTLPVTTRASKKRS